MPIFSRKKRDSDVSGVLQREESPVSQRASNGGINNRQDVPPPPYSPPAAGGNPVPRPQSNSPNSDQLPVQRPKLVFHCQQAQGSPTGIISGFTNITELYQKISECYDFPPSDILFCTLNTHKTDMSRLLGGQIGLDDFIFVHRKGQPKEVEVIKSEDALGLTITDNGAGYAFVKRIKEGSLMERIGYIQVGDHVEKINQESFIGCRHFQVAKALKDIPKGATFTMRLVEPLKAGFANIGPRSSGGGKKSSSSYGSGKETLRLRATGPATVQEAPDNVVQAAVDKLNSLLESFMGINDSELATQIWDLGKDVDNPHSFVTAIAQSELELFGFTDDFVFDLWGAISDAKAGRLKKDILADTIF